MRASCAASPLTNATTGNNYAINFEKGT